MMTTIATDGKTMAADTLINGSGVKHGHVTKLYQAENGDIIGVAGSAFRILPFIEWYNGDRKTPFEADPENFEALVLTTHGTIHAFNHAGDYIIESGPNAAAGSGSAVALGALDAGASPQEAVEIACRRDLYTGGNITVLSPKR